VFECENKSNPTQLLQLPQLPQPRQAIQERGDFNMPMQLSLAMLMSPRMKQSLRTQQHQSEKKNSDDVDTIVHKTGSDMRSGKGLKQPGLGKKQRSRAPLFQHHNPTGLDTSTTAVSVVGAGGAGGAATTTVPFTQVGQIPTTTITDINTNTTTRTRTAMNTTTTTTVANDHGHPISNEPVSSDTTTPPPLPPPQSVHRPRQFSIDENSKSRD
jgi:hypothetical protein